MTEDQAVALAEARNRLPGSGRWFAQHLADGSWRAVRVWGGPAPAPPSGVVVVAPPEAPGPQVPVPLTRREWGSL